MTSSDLGSAEPRVERERESIGEVVVRVRTVLKLKWLLSIETIFINNF